MPELSKEDVRQIAENFPKKARRLETTLRAKAKLAGLTDDEAAKMAKRCAQLEMRSIAIMAEAYAGSSAKKLMESIQ